MHEADMLVGNRQFLINLVARGDIDPDSIGLIVVDEAHFAAAASYQSIINYFDRALLTYFTGSKFRSDSQPMPKVEYETARDEKDPSVIKYAPKADYEFTLQDAWKLDPPPIKQIAFKEAHSGQFLVEEDGVEHKYDFKEFIAKANADKFWFRKILLAREFDETKRAEIKTDGAIPICKAYRYSPPQSQTIRSSLNQIHFADLTEGSAQNKIDVYINISGRIILLINQLLLEII